MVNKTIQTYADSGDITSLKYIFRDCFDVDPTFEKYRENWEYCKKNCPQILEAHKELNPLTMDKIDEDTWIKFKLDLMENFSEKRFDFMAQYAKEYYKDKIAKITAKREAERKTAEEERQRQAEMLQKQQAEERQRQAEMLQKQQAEERQRQAELLQRQQEEDRKRREAIQHSQPSVQAETPKTTYSVPRSSSQATQSQSGNPSGRYSEPKKTTYNSTSSRSSSRGGNNSSKKSLGVGLAVIIVVIVIIVILILIRAHQTNTNP